MRQQSIPQFGLEPGALGRHHLPAVRDVEQLLDTYGIKTEGSLHFTAVYSSLQLFQSTDTADKVDPLVGTGILYGQKFVQNVLLKDGHIQDTDGACAESAFFGNQFVPAAIDIKSEFMQPLRQEGILHLPDKEFFLQQVD